MSLACMPGSLRFRCGFVIRWPVTCTLIIFSVYLNYLKLVVIFELTLFTFAPLRPFIEKKKDWSILAWTKQQRNAPHMRTNRRKNLGCFNLTVGVWPFRGMSQVYCRYLVSHSRQSQPDGRQNKFVTRSFEVILVMVRKAACQAKFCRVSGMDEGSIVYTIVQTMLAKCIPDLRYASMPH